MKKITALLSLAAISVPLVFVANLARATIIEYTDPNTFAQALKSGYYDEGFDEMSTGSSTTRILRGATTNGTFSYSITDPGTPAGTSIVSSTDPSSTSPFVFTPTTPQRSLEGNSASGSMTFTFNTVAGSTKVGAFGGWFAVGGSASSDATQLTVNTIGGGSVTDTIATTNSGWVFRGYITTNTPGFSTLTITNTTPGNGDLPKVDDFITGIGIVPEPAFFQLGALLSLGVLAVLRARRRRQPIILNQI